MTSQRIVAVALALALTLAFATLALPSVQAHNCNSGEPGGCGECVEGENHAHNDPGNQCSTSAIPGFETLAALVALGGVAVAVGLRRR